MPWQSRALCALEENRGLPWCADTSHMSKHRRKAARDAMRAVCGECPVAAECRAYAERMAVTAGIWAGKNYRRELS